MGHLPIRSEHPNSSQFAQAATACCEDHQDIKKWHATSSNCKPWHVLQIASAVSAFSYSRYISRAATSAYSACKKIKKTIPPLSEHQSNLFLKWWVCWPFADGLLTVPCMPAAWWVLWKHLPGHTLPFTTSFQHFIELLYRGTSSAFFSTVKELDFLHLSRCLAFSSIAPCRKALKSSAMVKTIFAHWKSSHFKWSWDLNMFWVQKIIQILSKCRTVWRAVHYS